MTDLSTLDDAALAAALAMIQGEDDATRARLSSPTALRDAALYYASRGIAVFPCVPGGKTPLTKNGLHDATTDATAVGSWWRRQPTANIGMPTGRSFDVIDVDGPAGFTSYLEMVDEKIVPPTIGRSYTAGTAGREGRHVFIAPTAAGNGANIRPGIDYRGLGGYIIAPPSVGPDGRRYSWITPLKALAQP